MNFSRGKIPSTYDDHTRLLPHPFPQGTSGWRGIIGDDFTFPRVRLAVEAIAGHVLDHAKNPTVLVAHDTRFFSEEFARTAAIGLSDGEVAEWSRHYLYKALIEGRIKTADRPRVMQTSCCS